jgi:dTDP-glucose 4,6-dehydratase
MKFESVNKHEYKSVLVTGGAGFIGSNFLNTVVAKYPNTNWINLDCLNYCSSPNGITVEGCPNYIFVYGRIQDSALVTGLVNNFGVDCIIHFAAQSHVDNSFWAPGVFIDDNIVGTSVLLECCRNAGRQIQKFVYCSTDEVYGDSTLNGGNSSAKTEMCAVNPTNPYAASKAAGEMMCLAYFHSFGVPIVITRSNNVYGPNQYAEKLVPRFIGLLSRGEKCTIHGDGGMLRSWLHVDDLCSAMEIIVSSGNVGEVYNIGSDAEYSVNQIASMLIAYILQTADVDSHCEYVQDRVFNDTRYLVNSSKLHALGWTQKVPFIWGLSKTVDWYLERLGKDKCDSSQCSWEPIEP